MQSIRKQAFVLTAANGFTRLLGFGLRLILARLMGAEALGVMEMVHSVEMLALTPVTAGTPTAMSRMTAHASPDKRTAVLKAGLAFVFRLSCLLMPVMLILSPLIAYLFADVRTLPILLINVPCILLLGLGSVYNGYCYGLQQMGLPSFNECVEQMSRCIISVLLLIWLREAPTGVTAAIPCAAELFAAGIVLLIFTVRIPVRKPFSAPDSAMTHELTQLAVPVVIGRLCTTGLRAFNAFLIPSCLRISGLSAAASTAQYGLITGMAMPVLMLPGIVTGALSMAAAPAVTARESNGKQLHTLILRLRRLSFLIGLAAAAGIVVTSEFIGETLYATPALAGLLRLMAPLALLMAMQQVQHGIIHGLGLQRKQLTGSLIGSAVTTVMIALLTVKPHMRLYGVAIAMMIGQTATFFWGWRLISLCNDTKGLPQENLPNRLQTTAN